MTDVTTDEIVLDVSDEALFKVLDVRAAEEEGDALGLRVEVTGVEGVDYAYDLAFEPISEAAETDVKYSVGELTVMVPANSIDKLRGATLDLPSNPMTFCTRSFNSCAVSAVAASSSSMVSAMFSAVSQLRSRVIT